MSNFINNFNFNEIYNTYEPKLKNFYYSKTGDTRLSEELAHDCLSKIYDKRDKYKHDTNLKQWIFKVARNYFYNYLNTFHNKKIDYHENDTYCNGSYISEIDGNSFDKSKNKLNFNIKDLENVLDNYLNEYDAYLFKLKYIHGYKYQEIAQMLGLNQNTLTMKVFNIKNKIKNKINELKI